MPLNTSQDPSPRSATEVNRVMSARSPAPCGLSCRPWQPSVVIEVVRTHTPEPETLIELLRLSCTGHLVVFYFIGKQLLDRQGKPVVYQRSKYNSIAGSSGLELSVSHYLYGGEWYRNGKVFERRSGESPGKYASYLSGLLQATSRRVYP